MHREKFPEKVPFRLTRMLVHAMGVSGIEGNFRNTCESVVTVLRNNKDLSWRCSTCARPRSPHQLAFVDAQCAGCRG